jgi:hypothetical protein
MWGPGNEPAFSRGTAIAYKKRPVRADGPASHGLRHFVDRRATHPFVKHCVPAEPEWHGAAAQGPFWALQLSWMTRNAAQLPPGDPGFTVG